MKASGAKKTELIRNKNEFFFINNIRDCDEIFIHR